MTCGSLIGRCSIVSWNCLSSLTGDVRLNLLPNESFDGFWDALWLAIRPWFCCILEKFAFAYLLRMNVICFG